jgi:hypothetical protein
MVTFPEAPLRSRTVDARPSTAAYLVPKVTEEASTVFRRFATTSRVARAEINRTRRATGVALRRRIVWDVRPYRVGHLSERF